jgi:hypothetical protein
LPIPAKGARPEYQCIPHVHIAIIIGQVMLAILGIMCPTEHNTGVLAQLEYKDG